MLRSPRVWALPVATANVLFSTILMSFRPVSRLPSQRCCASFYSSSVKQTRQKGRGVPHLRFSATGRSAGVRARSGQSAVLELERIGSHTRPITRDPSHETHHRRPTTGDPPQETHHRRPTTGDPPQETHHRRPTTGDPPQETHHRRPTTGDPPQETHHRRPTTGDPPQEPNCT